MIYTLTLNPSLDYVMHMDTIEYGKTNRSSHEEQFAGGKGFNVSTILHRLNIPTLALGFIAGEVGNLIASLLQAPAHLIRLESGTSRINVKIKADKETEINSSGPFICEEKLTELMTFLNTLTSDDYLVLAGSIPSCLPQNLYKIILDKLHNQQIQIIVDTTGQSLKEILVFHPFLIKPNLDELEDLFSTSIKSENDLKRWAHELQKLGARNVLISLGAKGAYLVTEDKQYLYQQAAKGSLVNSVGSGDSMIAGFLCGYLQTHDYQEALLLGTACGGATAFSPDLATLKQIEDIKKSLVIATAK